jgi:hypothetical protein
MAGGKPEGDRNSPPYPGSCKFDCFSDRFLPSLQLACGFVDVTDSRQALLSRKRSGDLKSKIALREHVASG